MSQHILCNEPATGRCAPGFRLQASAWIDATNFGQHSIDVDPPAGIRLRWTCPFIALPPAERLGRPVSFIVERSALHIDNLYDFDPDVGHRSRAPTPRALWSPLDLADRLTFRVPGPECQGVSAVAFSVPADGNPATVTLIDVDGVAQVVADVAPGDDFHFEWYAMKLVSFSADTGVCEVIGLDLGRTNADLPLNFAPIAEIDAAAWLNLSLDEAAERIANGADEPFLSVQPDAWDELRTMGTTVDEAIAAGVETPSAAAAIAFATAISFETAALLGWGFIDGDHASAPRLDRIHGPLLDHPTGGLFAYRVRVHIQPLEGEASYVESTWAFARASLAPPLGDARCVVVSTPVSRTELTNVIRAGQRPDQPEIVEPASMRIFCAGQWDLASDPWTVEAVLTRPIAQDSAVTAQRFQSGGTFLSGLNRPPRRLRGNSLLERREHHFDVPFFDSDVDCELEVADFWDRRSPREPAGMVQPLIDYAGNAPPLQSAACRSSEQPGGAEVDLALDPTTTWSADLLASFARAKIALLMRNPDRTLAQIDVEAGPPSPTADGQWSADLRSRLAQSELDRFVGGQISVGALIARVFSMGPVQGGVARCTFDAVTSCAGADLYRCPTGWVAAYLSEDPHSDRLWIRLPDSINVLTTGAAARRSVTTALPAIGASATLYFASRLEFTFEGQAYRSPLTVPVPAPYLHPAPPAPQTCLAPRQLATDFYGRTLVRVEASHCHRFDPGFAIRLAIAPGEITDADRFLADRSVGIFAAQVPLEGKPLFEAFSRISTLGENEPYTVGAFNVRKADDIESKPALSTAWFRRVE